MSLREFCLEIAAPVAGVSALGVAGWLLTGHHSADVTGWVEATATVGAFLGAVIAARYAAGAYRLELNREGDRDRERRTAQAQLVAAWFGNREQSLNVDGKAVSVWQANGFNLRNASNLPVTNVVATVFRGSEPLGEVVLVPPVPPGEKAWFYTFTEEINQALAAGAASEDVRPIAIDLRFRDSAGIRWLRTADGSLSEQ